MYLAQLLLEDILNNLYFQFYREIPYIQKFSSKIIVNYILSNTNKLVTSFKIAYQYAIRLQSYILLQQSQQILTLQRILRYILRTSNSFQNNSLIQVKSEKRREQVRQGLGFSYSLQKFRFLQIRFRIIDFSLYQFIRKISRETYFINSQLLKYFKARYTAIQSYLVTKNSLIQVQSQISIYPLLNNYRLLLRYLVYLVLKNFQSEVQAIY